MKTIQQILVESERLRKRAGRARIPVIYHRVRPEGGYVTVRITMSGLPIDIATHLFLTVPGMKWVRVGKTVLGKHAVRQHLKAAGILAARGDTPEPLK